MTDLENKDSPAFPMDFQLQIFRGLTKREYIAIQIFNTLGTDAIFINPNDYIILAYKLADEFLKQSENKDG